MSDFYLPLECFSTLFHICYYEHVLLFYFEKKETQQILMELSESLNYVAIKWSLIFDFLILLSHLPKFKKC